MASNFPVPEESELEQLIAQSFAALPEAEYAQLQQVEERLSRKARLQKRDKNLNKIPWWIVLLLVGSFASAAWWAGELVFDKQNTEIENEQVISNVKITEQQFDKDNVESGVENKKQNEVVEDRDSPVIYQRELF